MTPEEFQEKLEELFIRFNTSPKKYEKEDYLILYEIIEELADLHDTRIVELKSRWDEVVASNTLPDGILIKETIEIIRDRISILETALSSIVDIVAKESTLTLGISEIKLAINNIDLSSVAQQGINPNASISTIQTQTTNALSDLAYIKTTSPYAKETTLGTSSDTSSAATVFGKIADVKNSLPTVASIQSGLAKEGTDTTATNTALKGILNGIQTTMYKGVPVNTISYTSVTTSVTVEANEWNIVGSNIVASLNILKGAAISNITNVYSIRFTLDSTWNSSTMQLVFKEDASTAWDLSWNGGDVPSWTAGNTYEINIVDNIACWIEIEPTV